MSKQRQDYISFKTLNGLDQRKDKYKQAMEKLPEEKRESLVLVIIQPHKQSQLPLMGNCRFCLDKQSNINYLREQISVKKLNVSPTTNLFFFIGKKMIVGDQTMEHLHKLYAEPDGFLYIRYAQMNVY